MLNNLFSRILDRLSVTQRTRQVLINSSLFILTAITFLTSTLEISPNGLKWISLLAFFANAMAGIIHIPNRMVPLGYDLMQDENGDWSLVKNIQTNWLGEILQLLRATDQKKTILANIGMFIVLLIAFLSTEWFLETIPKIFTVLAFAGNALAGIYNTPERTIPEGYELRQNEEDVFYIVKVLSSKEDYLYSELLSEEALPTKQVFSIIKNPSDEKFHF